MGSVRRAGQKATPRPWGLAVLGAMLALAVPQVASGASVLPLSASDYAVHSVCGAPEPGRAGCLALEMEPRTSAARARIHRFASASGTQTGVASAAECTRSYESSCLTPQDLHSAYFPAEEPLAPASQPQTIAVVDAYNDLNVEADLSVYDAEFDLPVCSAANGCFKKVNEHGSETPSALPFPKTNEELQTFSEGTAPERKEAEAAEGWALETATDVEMAHAVCQNCHVLLVEAGSSGYPQLETAENAAVALGATEISNSWGGKEEEGEDPDSAAFEHPGIVITAAAGDDGYLNWDQYATRKEPHSPYFEGADYPATSPHVVSVGGTSLILGVGHIWQSETPWNNEGAGGGGGGCSASLKAPEWQLHVSDWASVGCGDRRASADVSADANPSTGVDVYDSTPYPENKKLTVLQWLPIGGTSVASPIIASMFALAGGSQGVRFPAQTLYSHLGSSLLHDVSVGGNGACDSEYLSCTGSMNSLSPFFPLDCGQGVWICNATSGYDGPTGVGTPNGIGAFKVGEAPAKGSEEGKATSKGSEETKSEGESGKGAGQEESNSTGTEGGQSPVRGPEGSSGGQASPLGGGPSPESTQGGSESPTSPPGTLSVTPGSPKPAPHVSALTLTVRARAAVSRGGLDIRKLAISFRLSSAASVRITLAIRVGSGGHRHWRELSVPFAFAASRGLNRRRLHGSGQLSAGMYRLLVAPAGGKTRAIQIRVP